MYGRLEQLQKTLDLVLRRRTVAAHSSSEEDWSNTESNFLSTVQSLMHLERKGFLEDKFAIQIGNRKTTWTKAEETTSAWPEWFMSVD